LASGLLIIGIGREATKEITRLLKLDKSYEVTALLGKRYDSFDITGTLLEEKSTASVKQEMIERALNSFLGPQKQVPPMFSALKHKGTPLYTLARRAIEVERTPRKIVIKQILFFAWQNPRLTFTVTCSSGTYVRALVDDLGKKLGVGAAVTELRRTRIGPFSIDEAVPLQALNKESLEKELIQKEKFLLRLAGTEE
jgi:tRNA pseudouridine55 synthase